MSSIESQRLGILKRRHVVTSEDIWKWSIDKDQCFYYKMGWKKLDKTSKYSICLCELSHELIGEFWYLELESKKKKFWKLSTAIEIIFQAKVNNS